MGSQNRGSFLGTLNDRCRTILRTPKGTIILTTTHMWEFPKIGDPRPQTKVSLIFRNSHMWDAGISDLGPRISVGPLRLDPGLGALGVDLGLAYGGF